MGMVLQRLGILLIAPWFIWGQVNHQAGSIAAGQQVPDYRNFPQATGEEMVEEPLHSQAGGMLKPCWGIAPGQHSGGAVVARPLRGLRR